MFEIRAAGWLIESSYDSICLGLATWIVVQHPHGCGVAVHRAVALRGMGVVGGAESAGDRIADRSLVSADAGDGFGDSLLPACANSPSRSLA